MAKPKTETDGIYFLKILLYLILGACWFWLTDETGNSTIPIPVGLIVGVLFTRHERFKIDRKIEYAVLLVSAFVCFLLEAGLYLQVL